MVDRERMQARKRRAPRFSLSAVWIIPLAAVLAGGWLLYENVLSHGPTIVLELKNAEGLKVGSTAVKVRNVEVGHVQKLHLSKDYSGAVAVVRMDADTEPLLVADSKFWVVKPRVSRRGISGLNTILSGAYIQMRPGHSNKPKYRFKVLKRPPVNNPNTPGLSLQLFSKSGAALSIGDPVTYQGQQVGQIAAAKFDPKSGQMHYGIFIKAPFDQLITEHTQFWNRSGIDFRLTSAGVEVKVGTLEALLRGGVTFGEPADMRRGKPAKSGARFRLYPSHQEAREDRFDEHIKYVVLFDDSVRGLNAGAPVEFRGIRVGTVNKVPFFGDNTRSHGFEHFRIPVLIAFEPQRLGPAWSKRSRAQWKTRLQQMFDEGLRASVRPGNLITGAMYVDLQFYKKTKPFKSARVDNYPVFPSKKGGIAGLEQKVTALLDKLNNLKLGPAVNELNDTLAATTNTFNQMQKTLASLNKVLSSNSAQNLPAQVRDTLRDVQQTLSTYRKGQPTYDNINQALRRLNQVLEDLSPLARTLRRQPNALLFGRKPIKDPQPKASK